MRLQQRYSLVFLTVVAVIVVSMSISSMLQLHGSAREFSELTASSLEQVLIQQVTERGHIIGSFLADNMVNPLYRYDMQAMYDLTRAAVDLPDVMYVYVYDESGRIVHDGTREIAIFGERLDARLQQPASSSRLPVTVTLPDRIDFTRPISFEGQLLGGVHIGLSLASVRTEIGATEKDLADLGEKRLGQNVIVVVITSLVLIGAGLLLAVMVARSLVRPIQLLAEQAARIGKGDYDTDVEITRRDEIGELASAFREMSRNLQLTSEEVHYLAFHDSLTKLPNRVMLKRVLGDALARARRQETRVALLFVDLDDFKRVNDTLGHEAGDTLLKEFADRLRECVRAEDLASRGGENGNNPHTIARLGGDEFTLVLEGIRDSLDIAAIAERILTLLVEPFQILGHEIVVGASIGVTVAPEDGEGVEQLLKNADVAMYHAKEEGKNNFQFYNNSLNELTVDRLSLESDLRHALEEEQLCVHYQPLLDAGTGEVVGAEALLRWNHPERGMILPGEFVPMAEETGLIADLGAWVIRTVARDLKAWQNDGLAQIFAAVNVSSVQFRRQNLPQVVSSALWETGLGARCLRLEITETAIMRNTIQAAQMLGEIKAMGVGIWVDDFGTGYSSLNYLRRFPIDGVKIDRSFVADIVSDEDDRRIISAIIAMAHSLNMTVTAEGVEEEGQLDFLRGESCDLVQGHLHAYPMAARDFKEFLRTRCGRNEFDSETAVIRRLVGSDDALSA